MADPNPYVSKASLAQALEISESTVDEMVRLGVIPAPVEEDPEMWDWQAVDDALSSRSRGRGVGTIYVVGFADYVKIGFTSGPLEYRLSAIQTGAPEQLVVYARLQGTMADEAKLHRRFKHLRTYGEWFKFDGDVAEWIEGGCPL
jgi:hypothetical protein